MSHKRPLPQKIRLNLSIAFGAIFQNKLRAILTSLGIIFGVASVIAMLSIGEGARQEIMQQMKLLGVNNIVIQPLVFQEEGNIIENDNNQNRKRRHSPGLTLEDAENIQKIIPFVDFVSPEMVLETTIIRAGFKRSGKLVGIGEHYFQMLPFQLQKGRWFSPRDHENARPVAIIGYGIAARFFQGEEPLGKPIKCGRTWFTVVGVLNQWSLTDKDLSRLGIRNYNMDVYTPINTALLRVKNRTRITPELLVQARENNGNEKNQSHQIDRLVVKVNDSRHVGNVTEIISRLLQRRHNNQVDFEVIVPELLLKQEQRTRQIFNFVLGAIASISLIVGGIGIMNIMLASVMERIKEIGIRQALGATRYDILLQFLLEALMISISGGIIGLMTGYTLSLAIESSSGIVTIIRPASVFISLTVAMSTGLVFGIFPARNAAK
ncbi:MAG TPA: FtsX-like permease family protein [Candidatus Marinimicrobia bacterium]|nr:FtsX-like permease family protein [Candidatus Neomarinimicrobiota bacterium]